MSKTNFYKLDFCLASNFIRQTFLFAVIQLFSKLTIFVFSHVHNRNASIIQHKNRTYPKFKNPKCHDFGLDKKFTDLFDISIFCPNQI